MKIDFIDIEDRPARANYIAERFNKYLVGDILDVGCDTRLLKDILKNVNYTGIDIAGTPDIQVDLEKIEKLPFEDNNFSTTVCSEVLEHLDSLHLIFDEIIRVTTNYIIISLPNNWAVFRKAIKRGRGKHKYYGLPPTRPDDRHKWFFNIAEAITFAKEQGKKHNLSIIEMIANEEPTSLIKRIFRHIWYPENERYLNRYGNTIWIVFKKI